MDKKKLLIRLVTLMFLMFAFFFLERKFHWYYSVWWSDMPMHFFGGFWVGLFFIYVFFQKNLSSQLILKILLWVLFVSILWELFEVWVFNYMGQNAFSMLDSISDLSLGLAGGFSAVLYFFKKIMYKSGSEVSL